MRTFDTLVAIKRLAAIVLLVALFLPLSQCTLEEQDPQTKATKQTITVTYAYTAYRSSIGNALAAYGAFLWPLILMSICLIWPGLNHKWAVAILEIALCLGSAYELLRLTLFGEWLYGAYVAAGATGAYLIAVFVRLAARLREKWIRRFAAPVPR